MARDKYYTEEQLNAYDTHYTGPYKWAASNPITATRMNTLEAGVVEALLDASDTKATVATMQGDVTDAKNKAANAVTVATRARTDVDTALSESAKGNAAWTQIAALIRAFEGEINQTNYVVTPSSANVSSIVTSIRDGLERVTSELNNARTGYTSLSDRLSQIDSSIVGSKSMKENLNNAMQDIINLRQELHPGETTGVNWTTFAEKLSNIWQSIHNVTDEVNETHRSDRTNDRLVNRLNEIDNTDVDENNNKLFPNSIANRLNALDGIGNESLITRVSNLETEIISGLGTGIFTNTRLDQMYNEIANAHRSADLVPGGDTLQFRFNALDDTDAALNTAITGINSRLDALDDNENSESLISRVSAIENEINLENEESAIVERFEAVEDTVSEHSTTLVSLTNRMDAVDGDNGALAGIDTRLDALEDDSRLTAVEQAIEGALRQDVQDDTLDNRFDDIEGRLDAIEAGGVQGASSTVVVDNATFNENDEPVLPDEGEPDPNTDYLIKKDDKYYYWKYINDEWNLISGGGSGTGTSSTVIAAALPAASEADANIDYYIGTNVIGYTHYRYIPSENEGEDGIFISILPKKLTDNLNSLVNSASVKQIQITTSDAIGDTPAVVTTVSGGLEAYNIGDNAHNNNLYADFVALRAARLKKTYKEDGITLDKQYLIFTDTNGAENSIEIQGGGGMSANYTVRLVNNLPSLSFSTPTTQEVVNISAKPIINFGTTLAEGLDISGNIQYKLSTEGVWRNSNITLPIITNNVPFSVNVASILGNQDTTTDIRLYVSVTPDGENGDTYSQYITYHITRVEMTIETSGYNAAVVRNGTSFMLDYTCYGLDLSKIVYFKIDGNTVATANVGTSHNEMLHQNIPLTYMDNGEQQFISNGMHTFQVYFEAVGNTSNVLNYYLIYNRDSERVAPLVGVSFEKSEIHFGDELKFNYTVYTNGQDTTDRVRIELYTMNGSTKVPIDENQDIVLLDVPNSHVETYTILEYPQQAETYRLYADFIADKIIPAETAGEDPTIISTTETISISIRPFESSYELKYAGTDALLYSYSAYGRTNNDANKEIHQYTFTTHDAINPTITFTSEFNNFNWATNGYEDGALIISGGATCDINVPVFAASYEDISIEGSDSTRDITERGRTVEIDYEVVSAINLNDTIISCMNEGSNAGINITPQNCYLTSNNRPAIISDDGTGTILNEAAIAAAYLTTGQRTHLVFVIEPWATTKAYDNKFHQSVNIYLNGEFANASPYFRDNSTGAITDTFATDATIHIGNSSCIIKLYSVKLYNRGLSSNEVLQNYKMSPRLTTDKIARFEKNNVIKNNKVDYELARKKFNCLLLVGPEPDYVLNAQGYPYNRIPTISPYKGAPSPINRMSGDEVVGKTESGLVFTMPDDTADDGFVYGFNLLDKLTDGGYASSNNVQGTSSQKYPTHNLKVYLAKGKEGTEVFDTETTISVKEVYKYSITTAATKAYKSIYPDADAPSYITKCASNIADQVKGLSNVPTQAEVITMIVDYLTAQDAAVGTAYTTFSTGDELITHPLTGYTKSDKVKYRLPGAKYSKGESTLCWKADYMSTDHANTFNANIADNLFTDSLNPNISNETWKSTIQNTVYGIRCLLFKQEGSRPIEFVADGCLNNDKGNSKSYGLEYSGDDGANTSAQKWEFTNNSDDLGFFKYDCVFYPTGNDQHYRAKDAFESCYPDQGDLEDAQDAYKAAHNNEEDPNLNPNYNHLQVLLTWVAQRANYWEASDAVTGETYTYDGVSYNNLKDYKKAIFKKEFGWHFNLDHVLTYYVFSEYVALCDNRVKNMFMRSDTIKNEVIKLTNGDVLYKGNENPNAEFWKHFIDINTGAINKAAIVTNITKAYMAAHTELEEEVTPDYANTIANQVVTDAAASATKLTMEQVENLIVSYLAAEEQAVSDVYIASRPAGSEEVVYERMMANADQINWLQDNTDTAEIPASTSRFAVWAPVLYDLDSCFGVENVGYLKIPYNADWQYYQDGQYLFNGHDSIFWLMVEDAFASEIYAKAKRLYDRDDGLNYHNFYNVQITDNNKAIAPAMTNQDMILKFDEPWATGFMNYANKPPTYETPEYKYLQRGSRAAQKDAFLFKRSMLLSSKYQADAFLNDKVSFRYGADLSSAEAVIECSANQIMYPAVSFGDNKGWTQALELVDGTPVIDGRVEAGKKCRIRATSSAKGQDTLFIAGASVLTDIGDLSVFKPYEVKVGYCKNLKKLVFGSDAAGYSNEVTDSIGGLSSCILLEEINIRNCKNITNLDLSANGLIKTVYASGSGASTISLPAGGVLTTLELGDKTASIKLVNQSYFTNFSYQDAETNHYASVKELWVENTDNVPIEDILVNRLPSNTFEGLRLVGIDIDIGNEPLLLELLATEDYITGKFINADGGRDRNRPPYISGTIAVNAIRESLLAKLNSLYPNLVINARNITKEYSLTYKNVDAAGNETTLLTLYRTSAEQIPDPILDKNPITNKYYIQEAPANQIGFDGVQYVPLRAEDAQYKYKCGDYDSNGVYQRYSGWSIKDANGTHPSSDTSIIKNMVFLAEYPSTELQTYTITWYDDDGSILYQATEIAYGEDGSALTAPSKYNTRNPLIARKIRNGVYKIFRGWNRPVGVVKGDINVYSQWYESYGDFSNFTSINDLNPADFYALTQLDPATREQLLTPHLGKDVKYIQLGRDFDYDANEITTYNLIPAGQQYIMLNGTSANVKIYDGTHEDLSIYPMIQLEKDWTFALDFKFLMDRSLWKSSSQEFVLASCYRNVNNAINGFRLSLVKSNETYQQIQLIWGNTTPVTIDRVAFSVNDTTPSNDVYNTYRNMIVLRHLAKEPEKIYIYYSSPSSDPQYYNPSGVISTTDNPVIWNSTTPVENPLILGGNYNSAGSLESSSTRTMAKGIIYYAKFWNEDLGGRNCLELAAWPHETVAYKISGFYDGKALNDPEARLTMGNPANNMINFTPAQAIGDRVYDFNVSGTNAFTGGRNNPIIGWENSYLRRYMNNTVYNAFPTAYQSLMEKIPITSLSQQDNSGVYTSVSYDIEDFIYLPCYFEIDPSLPDGSTYRTEAHHAWQWLDLSNITNVYKLNENILVQDEDIEVLNYLRFHFFRRPVLPTTRIFHMTASNNPYGVTFRDEDNVAITVQPGDIWFTDSMAYMYMSAEDIAQGVEVDKSKAAGNGGWAPALIWATRTFNFTDGAHGYAYDFMKVLRYGAIKTKEEWNEYATARALVPQFSI